MALETVENQPLMVAHLTLGGDLTEEQCDRLREIGDRCPVHRLLSRATAIQTVLAPTMAATDRLISVDGQPRGDAEEN